MFSYVEAAFIAYEEEIDRQKKVIAQLLRFKNERLENGQRHSIGASSHDNVSIDNSYTSLRSLSRHAACVANVVRTQSGGCDMKALVLAREVLRRLERGADEKLDSGLEARVNKAIVGQLEFFYQEIRDRHKGRFPEIDRRAWTSLNSIMGGVKGVPLAVVAQAIGVERTQLRGGKQRWQKWLDYDGEGDAPYLQAISSAIHGNFWPQEWIEFILQMWENPRCTRKGESASDYCYDPKQRKDRPKEPHVVHYQERPLYAIQDIMQTEGEIRFPADFLYADGKPRSFPKRYLHYVALSLFIFLSFNLSLCVF